MSRDRKSQKDVKSLTDKSKRGDKSNKVGLALATSDLDLNETCEFQDGATFRGAGDTKRKRGDGSSRHGGVDVGEGSLKEQQGEEVEEMTCQVCGKALSHMNSQRRLQHVNRCIDLEEEKVGLAQREAELLETARTYVLDCPMCGKHFKVQTARVSHLKKCSQSLGVATDRMLQLVRDQETERQNMVASGILPPALSKKIEKKPPASKKRKVVKEPKDQFEEDIQVAIAISSSMAETHSDQEAQLQKVKKRKEAKRNKTTQNLQDTCLLTTLTDEDRMKRLEEKVNHLLMQEYPCEVHQKVALCKSRLGMVNYSGPGTNSLWEQAADGTKDIQHFYVARLMPPISVSRVLPGSKIKSITSIPGRETSFVEERGVTHMADEDKGGTTRSSEEIISVSTQSVVLLAEAAMEGTKEGDSTLTQGDGLPGSHGGSPDLQASGFCVQTVTLKPEESRKVQEQVLSDYKKLLNSADFSDVKISSSEGRVFHGHQVILGVRCPQLLKENDNGIILLKLSTEATWALLRFVYAGEVNMTSGSQAELLEFSDLFQIHTLKEMCTLAQLEENSENMDMGIETGDKVDNIEEFGESKIDLKMIWGESDSDSDAEDKDHTEEGVENTDDEQEEDRDILCEEKALSVCRPYLSVHSERNDTSDDRDMKCIVSEGSDKGKSDVANSASDTESEVHVSVNQIGDFSSISSSDVEEITDLIKLSKKCKSDDDDIDNGKIISIGLECISPPRKRIQLSEDEGEQEVNKKVEDESTLSDGMTKCGASVDVNVGPFTSNEICNSPEIMSSPSNGSSKPEDISTHLPSLDTSGVDLFNSPSPVKSRSQFSVASSVAGKYQSDESETATNPHDEILVDCLNNDSVVKQFSCHIPEKESTCIDSEDNDVEIKGDNFDEMSKNSPAFKCSSSRKDKKERQNYVTDAENICDNGTDLVAANTEDLETYNYCFDESFNDVDNDLSNEKAKYSSVDLSKLNAEEEAIKSRLSADESKSNVINIDTDSDSDASVEVTKIDLGEAVDDQNVAAPCGGEEGAVTSQHDNGVWEDFDDMGVDFDPPPMDMDPSPVEMDLPPVELDPPPMDIPDSDDSLVSDMETSCDTPAKHADAGPMFKTPTANEDRLQRDKPWVAPSPFTPMPKYTNMATPVLKKEVQKYGVKPVGKKRMIQLLQDIYQQTHQYETDSELEDETGPSHLAGSSRGTCKADPGCHSNQGGEDGGRASSEDMPTSQGNISSQESEYSDDLPEESFLNVASSDSDTAASPQKTGDLNRRILDFIQQREALNVRVLMYEPLELDVLKSDLKEASIKCSMEKLMDFLDEKCIAFTTKNARQRKTSARGKRGGKRY